VVLARLAPAGGIRFDAIAIPPCARCWATGSRRLAVTVVLADDLVRLWQVTPPPGAAAWPTSKAAAALRFQRLFGEAPAGWRSAPTGRRAALPGRRLPRAAAGVLERAPTAALQPGRASCRSSSPR
jgi:hypothetical protein